MLQLETITASLAEGYKQLEPESFRTSAELTTERRTNLELRDIGFYTANFGMYDVEDGKEVLYFGEKKANLILANIDEACDQLIKTGNYKVHKDDKQAVIDSVESGHTLRVVLSDLHLKRHDDEYSFFEVDTKDYDSLNKSQRALAERIYGQGDDFVENMKILSKADVNKTKVYVLNQDYVKKNTKEGAIARACWLGSFYGDSYFVADDRYVYDVGGLRGVLKSAEGGDVQKPEVDKIAEAYKTILDKPRKAVEKMTPEIA